MTMRERDLLKQEAIEKAKENRETGPQHKTAGGRLGQSWGGGTGSPNSSPNFCTKDAVQPSAPVKSFGPSSGNS